MICNWLQFLRLLSYLNSYRIVVLLLIIEDRDNNTLLSLKKAVPRVLSPEARTDCAGDPCYCQGDGTLSAENEKSGGRGRCFLEGSPE